MVHEFEWSVRVDWYWYLSNESRILQPFLSKVRFCTSSNANLHFISLLEVDQSRITRSRSSIEAATPIHRRLLAISLLCWLHSTFSSPAITLAISTCHLHIPHFPSLLPNSHPSTYTSASTPPTNSTHTFNPLQNIIALGLCPDFRRGI